MRCGRSVGSVQVFRDSHLGDVRTMPIMTKKHRIRLADPQGGRSPTAGSASRPIGGGPSTPPSLSSSTTAPANAWSSVPRRAALVRHLARSVRARRATQLSIATAVACSVQWTMDFKGNSWLGHRSMCHPLTLQDDATRYVLCVDGTGAAVLLQRLRALDEHGPRPRGAGDALPGRLLRGVA